MSETKTFGGKWLSRSDGFTIVELIIVVIVIAILATITIVAYNGITSRATNSAVSQNAGTARKKLELYKATNGAYPVTGNLSAAGVADGQSTYQYTSVNGSTFCLTATTGTVSYYVNSSDTQTPKVGGCAGHGQGGVAAITNYYIDPKPVGTAPVTFWAGNTGNVATYANAASAWSASGVANRITYSAVTNNNGGPIIYLNASYAPYAGQQYTVSADVRLISGISGLTWMTIDRDGGAGTVTLTATNATVASMTVGQTYKIYATFTADSAAAAANLRFYALLGNKSATAVVDIADVDLYPGAYDPARTWHSGDSTNWVWNGTANASSSTGPAQ